MIIGLGTDIAEVDRFRFDAAQLERFAVKVFTIEEMAHARRHRKTMHERLAGAFAAKEATRKAFGHAIPWREVGVRHEPTGKPYVELTGRAAQLIMARGVRRMHLTISHSKQAAVATVILEADDPAGGVISLPYDAEDVAAR
ncbi:MAG: holo-ACP synthase [Candidatus Eremiobacteraeota bacterium]|nr:holo-ACP synthase [Candidatus Eremiobacteraeota bacterium]MBV8205022.1 holo-ACP synthase [Candidatus Eremiobacteraeota bacterium]MBV8339022.1 holo-ACP synthase [Candidatus Eremiobacteraeota bacterium]MBV8670120.1 holo-ACP synthase [Candidatus Eremiobacteraeota bacterium]